jgi:hypothetical protein
MKPALSHLVVTVSLAWSGMSGAHTLAGEPVMVVDLSGDWAFAYTPAAAVSRPPDENAVHAGQWALAYTPEQAKSPPPKAAFIARMPVPGCWDDRFGQRQARALWPAARFNPARAPVFPSDDNPPDGSLPFLVGIGWYRRTIDVPAEWNNRQITLDVGRVVMEASVYVNGRPVHHHLGHSTGFEVSLTGKLDAGRPNELVVAVDNARTDRIGCVVRGWQGRSGGIFGPVRLRVAGKARIAGLYVYPDAEQLRWRAELEGPLPPGCSLSWTIADPRTGRRLSGDRRPVAGPTTRWTSASTGLEPWSDRRPRLYQLEVGLWSGTTCLDVCRQPFGLRRLAAAGTGLRLNGSPLFLRGICDCAYFPLSCTPPTDAAWYRGHLRHVRQIGFNWLRCHTWVPLEPYLQAADELGMLIQVEPPLGYGLSEWRDIVRACRKHPSVVIYCCGNEEQLDRRKIDYLRQCAAELRTLAPDALFNPQEALRGVEYGDLGGPVERQPFPHNPARLARLKEFSDVFGQYTHGRLSYASLAGEPAAIDRFLAIYQRPCLSHELGICGSYLDLALEQRYQGTRIGPGLFRAAREALGRAGVLDRASVYYRNSAAWQRLILKDAMETARQCRLLAGYDCLGANDNHWHRTGYGCGVLNEFDELKPGRSVADILSYNGESVLLVSQQRQRNLRAGESLRRELSLSWFGEGTLRAAGLRWSLRTADGALLAGRREPVGPIPAGTVATIASIAAVLPRLDRPLKATLEVELTAPRTRLANRWDYWVFPPVAPTAAPGVVVVGALDAHGLETLAAGRRVVLLGSRPFPVRPLSFQIAVAGRPMLNLATVIAKHPLTDRFPHDGYCDWQFSPMLAGAAAVELDRLPAAFDPILEVVSSYKQIRRQAALFEWRVGAGRLLVCTLNLPETDPAACYLRRQILDYAAGDQFQPRTRVAPQELARLLNLAPATTPPSARSDEGFDRRGQLPGGKKNP